MTDKNLDYYLSLPYSYIIEWSEVDNCFLGSIVEFEHNGTRMSARHQRKSFGIHLALSWVESGEENSYIPALQSCNISTIS